MADQQNRRKRPTKLDWDRYETKIRRLYLDENRSLASVREILARDDEFHAR